MTSLSSSSRSPRSHSTSTFLALLFVTAIGALLNTSCADKHIGRPCMTGLPSDPSIASVNAQALECPSRICLLPAQTTTKSTAGPMCTDYCSTDDDCSDGEKFDATTNPMGCKGGFACRTPIPKLNNPLACKRVCVCRDFLLSTDPDLTPPSCN